MAPESTEFIRSGLAGICGVDNLHFNEKHWGAALIAAGLLIDQELSSKARSAAISGQAARLMNSKAAWLPAPVPSGPGDVDDVVSALSGSAGSLSLLGHDTIFTALALRAMAELPELATAANVDALVEMIEFAATSGPGGPFPGWDDPAAVGVEREDDIPHPESDREIATSATTAFAGVGSIDDGRDRGVVHHVLTHAHALIELRALGHTDAARSGIGAHRIYRKLLTRRPTKGERPLPADAPQPAFRSARYWQQDLRGGEDWLFGHVFKVALAWHTLEPLLPDTLRHRAVPVLATSMVVT